jgi:hypothetical protein
MAKEIPIPETVGELVELLSKYPKEAKLTVSIIELFDNGSVYPTDSYKMSIYEGTDLVDITFANGNELDN